MKLTLKEHVSDKLITVGRQVSAQDAHRIMANFWVRHLPVVDEQTGEVVGMISERDLLSTPSEFNTVEEMMPKKVESFELGTPIKTILRYLIENKASACLISEDEEVIGIVTVEDMMIMLDQMLSTEDHDNWNLSEILMSPALQKAAYLIGQTGL